MQLKQPPRFGDAGVVDKQRHMPEFPLDAAHHPVHGRGVGDVGAVGDDGMSLRAQLIGKLFSLVLTFDIIDADGIAGSGQLLRRRGADAAGRAGDQGDLHASPSLSFSAAAITSRA